jgi:hypothetical protein
MQRCRRHLRPLRPTYCPHANARLLLPILCLWYSTLLHASATPSQKSHGIRTGASASAAHFVGRGPPFSLPPFV